MSCTSPPVVQNGFVSYSSLINWTDKTDIYYQCYKYYGLVDSDKLTCSNAKWTGTMPKCEYHSTTEIVFWFLISLLALLLLLLLALLIFVCCHFCRRCKYYRRGCESDNENEDTENSTIPHYSSACCGSRKKTSRNKNEKQREDSMADTLTPNKRVEELTHSERTSKDDEVCCASFCCPNRNRNKTHPEKQRQVLVVDRPNQKNNRKDRSPSSCCTQFCISDESNKKEKNTKAAEITRDRSKLPKKDGQHDHANDSQESGQSKCCLCLFGSKKPYPTKTDEKHHILLVPKDKKQHVEPEAKSKKHTMQTMTNIKVDDHTYLYQGKLQRTETQPVERELESKPDKMENSSKPKYTQKTESMPKQIPEEKGGTKVEKSPDEQIVDDEIARMEKENNDLKKQPQLKNRKIQENDSEYFIIQDQLKQEQIEHAKQQKEKMLKERENQLQRQQNDIESELERQQKREKERQEEAKKQREYVEKEDKKELERKKMLLEKELERQQRRDIDKREREEKQRKRLEQEKENQAERQRQLDERAREKELYIKQQEELAKQQAEEKRKEKERKEKERRDRLQEQEDKLKYSDDEDLVRNEPHTSKVGHGYDENPNTQIGRESHHTLEDDDYIENESPLHNDDLSPRRARKRKNISNIKPRYLDYANSDHYQKRDSKIYGHLRVVKPVTFWRPSKNPIRYYNMSTL